MLKAIESTKQLRFVSRCIDRIERAIDWVQTSETLTNPTHIVEDLYLAKEQLQEWKKEPDSSPNFQAAYHFKNNAMGSIGLIITGHRSTRIYLPAIRSFLESALSLLIEERELLETFIREIRTVNEVSE